MKLSNREEYLTSLTPEQREEFRLIEQDAKIIEKILKDNSEFDPSDLFQITYRLRLSPEERLSLGLQRRMICYDR
ncbi:MAG: hypothetical protein D6719_00335 [Candidatus Dadabacteria bacterium]|nr:MAG: hypothetical protein D6719_00335 [Candidatus Dadabacteria bacterium]